MDAQVGDSIVVESHQVGAARRAGRVTEVLGTPGARHYRVRWEDGHETVFFPSSDCHLERSVGSEDASAPVRATTQVELRFEEDADHTEAWATLHTAAGSFRGWGRARRHPADPNLPLVGEELAAARALMELAAALREAAGDAMERQEAGTPHLVG